MFTNRKKMVSNSIFMNEFLPEADRTFDKDYRFTFKRNQFKGLFTSSITDSYASFKVLLPFSLWIHWKTLVFFNDNPVMLHRYLSFPFICISFLLWFKLYTLAKRWIRYESKIFGAIRKQCEKFLLLQNIQIQTQI